VHDFVPNRQLGTLLAAIVVLALTSN